MGHVNAESLEKLDILDKFDIAIRRGVARALWEHKKNGRAAAICRDGKVVLVPPEEIEIPDEFLMFLENKKNTDKR